MDQSPKKFPLLKVAAIFIFLFAAGVGAFLLFSGGESAVSGDTTFPLAGDTLQTSTQEASFNEDNAPPKDDPPAQSVSVTAKTQEKKKSANILPVAAAPRASQAAATATTTTVPATVPSSSLAVECPFPASGGMSRKIIWNEIAWMGAPSSTGASADDAAKQEWMELKNISGNDVILSGWEIVDASKKIKIMFGDDDAITAGGFFILARNTSTSLPGAFAAQKIYSGGLANTGDVLALLDPQCAASDILDASHGWAAGNNITKQTLERDDDGIGWHTSALPGGTPGKENSLPSLVVPSSSPVLSAPVVLSPAPVVAPQEYEVGIILEGDASGTVTSDPQGINCGTSCLADYPAGTLISLGAAPSAGATFTGWSAPCSVVSTCSFVASDNTVIHAVFNLIPSGTSTVPAASSTSASSSVATQTPSGHLLIAQIQVGGASSTNDLIKLYNPTTATVDASGWKLHKRSETGTDYSLRTFPADSLISPGQYFVWANSSGGFSEAVGANVSSTETLAADNSAALLDASGTVIDAVAWGSGTGQYVETAAYPTSPAPNQVLARNFLGGKMADTDNNAADFMIL